MKYTFTITLDIKGQPQPNLKVLKSIAADIQATLAENNDCVGLGYDDALGEGWYADKIKVKVG